MIPRALLIWLLIALAETIHGALRVKFLNRRVGDKNARRIAVFTGSIIILAIGWLTVPWIGPVSPAQSIVVGSLWLLLMLAFDIVFGKIFFRATWARILADFDLRKGGFLGLGMLVLLLTPLLIGHLRNLW